MLSTTDKILFLKRVPLFHSLSFEQLQVLSAHLSEEHFLAGEVIFYEGDVGQELYVVVRGRVEIIKDYGKAAARTLATLGAGAFFGEMAIFENAPRSATAVAAVETEVLVLAAEKFRQTIYQKPDMAFAIFRELSARLRRREAEVLG